MAGLGPTVTVTSNDVAEGWRALSVEQKAAAATLITRAEPILIAQSPGLLGRLDAGTTPVEAAEQVIIQAVRRAMLPLFNPDGVRRFTKSIEGEYSESLEWDGAALARGLDFTAAELALVAGPVRASRGKAFTINTAPRTR